MASITKVCEELNITNEKARELLEAITEEVNDELTDEEVEYLRESIKAETGLATRLTDTGMQSNKPQDKQTINLDVNPKTVILERISLLREINSYVNNHAIHLTEDSYNEMLSNLCSKMDKQNGELKSILDSVKNPQLGE